MGPRPAGLHQQETERIIIMSNITRPSTQARNKQFIAGIQKRLQNVSQLPIAGTNYTPADLVKLFQSQIDKADAIAPLKGKYHDAVQAYRDLSKQLARVVIGFRTQVRNIFGDTSEVLADFGLTPVKTTKPKPATQVSAAAKRAMTRKARSTMGKKQKKSVKAAPPAPATGTKPT
jgi:hypothetical protein